MTKTYNSVGEAIAAREARLAQERVDREKSQVSEVAKRNSRVRTGKTARDRANGAAQRAAERKMARADWQKNASKTNPGPFPV